MIVEAQVTIDGSRAAVWAAITDIEHASRTISGIKNIEVLVKPPSGLVGLRWRETRIPVDRPVTVEKWITDAVENQFCETREERDGFVFVTTRRIAESRGGITLIAAHESRPRGILARLMSIPVLPFFKGVVRKALLRDLNDIKAAVERK